jgi:ATP-dependent Clp protease ATP-binding subunit ClpC
MFERYTEKARRVIFFARYEAAQFGSPEITTEHLLLGILREAPTFLANWATPTDLITEVRATIPTGKKISTSVDLPLSDAAKRVLAYGAEEAGQLGHKLIGSEHLVLGLLEESATTASEILHKHGMTRAQAHARIKSPAENEAIVRALRKTFTPMASRLTPEVEPSFQFSLQPGDPA